MVNDTLQSGGIHFTGLGSGTDFDSIIEGLIKVESIKKQRLELWQSTWEAKVESFQELNTQMLSLKTTLEGLNTPGEFLTKTVDSSLSSVVSGTAGSDAQEGVYSVDVSQLAQNEVTYSLNPISNSDTVDLTSGAGRTFNYTYDGFASNALSVPSGTTLEGLVNIINADPENHGVRAEVLKIDDNDYRLKMVGLDQGADNTITINADTTLPNFSDSDFSDSQSAQDSVFVVDGISLTRSTNTVDDAITGLTLNLKDVASGAKLSVATDTAAVKENIRTFVDQVNEVRSLITEMTKFDETTEQGSILTGNYGLEIISQNLKSITASRGIGFDPDEDTYVVLSQLGITTDAEAGSVTRGQLIIDEEALDEALTNDIDAVAELFSAYYDGATNSTDFVYASRVSGTTKAGIYGVSYDITGGSVQNATIGGYSANYDSSTNELTATSGPATGLAIKINNLNDGSYSGEVRLRLGKTTEMVDELKELTSSTDGTLHILEDNYQDIIDNIQKKIDSEERRLAAQERQLRNRFARLEAVLGEYNALQNQLNSQLAQLPND